MYIFAVVQAFKTTNAFLFALFMKNQIGMQLDVQCMYKCMYHIGG